MLRNYFKIAVRNLLRHRTSSFINLFGLAIGIASCGLILLFVRDELSYDRFHRSADDIYRVAWMNENPQTRTPHPMAQALVNDFPDVEAAVSLTPIWGAGLTRQTFSVRYQDQVFEEKNILAVDTAFFRVFSFPFLAGNPQTALREPNAILLTREAAARYFGGKDALGKVMRINNQIDLKVTGILENIPANAHFHFDFLIAYATLKNGGDRSFFQWGDFGHYNYVRLKPGTDPQGIERQIPDWLRKYLDWSEAAFRALKSGVIHFRLQPITEIHLHSNLLWELEPNGNVGYVYIFVVAAFFILLIACVNFINLTTARSVDRAREVGLRKTIGANRGQLIRQFLGESTLLCFLAVAIALILMELSLPAFNLLAGKNLAVPYFQRWYVGAMLVALPALVGLLAGAYPALLLSSFEPVKVLKGRLKASASGIALRKGLVVLQFVISISLIVGTLVMYDQINYLRNKHLGFDKERVVILPMKDSTMQKSYESLKSELLRNAGIEGTTAVSSVPGGRFDQHQVQWVTAGERRLMAEVSVDSDFLRTMRISLVKGRAFTPSHALDTTGNYFMLNEAAARQFAWKSAIGERITFFDNDAELRGTVIGVVKDFNFQSLHQPIMPMVFRLEPEQFNYLLVRLKPNQIPATLRFLGAVWKERSPERPFEFSFLDSDTNALYRAEQRMSNIFGAFAALALVIACLGLFGLVTYTTRQRTKEIGIRKVLGAPVTAIVRLLSGEFVQPILIANLVAWPLAWWGMHQWLRTFAYRVELGWGVFV
ncbi:MAG: ABC transporter permease, partial [Ferruginibacter sp.]|nr:ABC transporter permease [Cytophagales bacterium]